MTRQPATLVAAFGFIFPSLCHAQALPTNTDLKAAYCIAVLNAGLKAVQDVKDLAEQLPQEAQATFNRGIASREEVKNRLDRYLVPRLSGLEMAEIVVAMQSGENDFDKGGHEVGNCRASCKPSKANACEFRCMDAITPLTVKIRSCNEVSWLHY